MSTAVDTDIPMRLEPVDERSVWLGDELRRDDKWSHQITDTELRELLAATETVHSAGLKVGDFGQEDFPLPTLGPQIKKLVDEVENGRGVALLKGFPVGELSEDMLRLAYWGFGVYAGNIISQNSKGQLLAEVSDRGNAYGDRNTRGFSTNAELLPHVDTSDMTTLLCLRPARTGGESRVLSSTAVYNAILREAPEHLGVLYRGFQNDLRGEGPTGDINELTHDRIPVYSYHAGRVSCSFNQRMIDNAAMKLQVPLSESERAALDCLRAVTLRDDHAYWFRLEAGDIQLVSNHSAFHSRMSFEDFEDPEQRRCLYRFWINIPGGRELAENFADRYNTGPRGGVAVGEGARYVF